MKPVQGTSGVPKLLAGHVFQLLLPLQLLKGASDVSSDVERSDGTRTSSWPIIAKQTRKCKTT